MSNSFKARLLPLPFGQNLAVTDSSINSLRDHIEKVMPGLEALDAIGPGKDFQSQSLFTCIGDLKLSAQTHHPISLKRKESPDSIGLLVPFGGQGEYRVGNRPYVPRSGQVAVFLSGATRTVKTDISSEVLFHLDKSRLMSTIDAMLGPDHTAPSSQDLLELQKDREIPLQGPAGDFQSLFRHALGIHDALHGQNQALQMLGLDETLYRGFVMLLCPNLFWRHPETKPRYRTERRRLDALCDFILAHLDEPLSLTLLEKQSGMSARSLQLAFKKVYGQSPMKWIINARLQMAHSRLCNPGPSDSVQGIALDCGFCHLGDFARRYQIRFGGSPSQTLKQARHGF